MDREGQRGLAVRVRAVLAGDDAYATVGKPACDWDDRAAKDRLVDALVVDALAALSALEGEPLGPVVAEKAELLALVAGQDVEQGEDGVFGDRPQGRPGPGDLYRRYRARHGHKSRARTFDGYTSHICLDPDSELIAEVTITAGNAPDRDVVDELIATDTTGEVAEQVAAGQVGVDRDGRLRLRRR